MEILSNIPVKFDYSELLKEAHLEKGTEDAESFRELVNSAGVIAKPKVVCSLLFVEQKGEDFVDFGTVKFTSRVLRINLDKVGRVFVYIATCGNELDGIPLGDDLLKQYWLDIIKTDALYKAREYFIKYINKKYNPGHMSEMNPGSGTADIWPIEQQEELFSVFGDVEKLIGVKLKSSYLMLPNKSVSGLLFPTESSFASCQLCPREVCVNRRAPYDPVLVKKFNQQ